MDGNKRSFADWGDFGIATDVFCSLSQSRGALKPCYLFLGLLIFYKYLELLHKMAVEEDYWQLDSAVTHIRGNLPLLLSRLLPLL